MELFVEEFEVKRKQHLDFDVSAKDISALLEGTSFDGATDFRVEVDAEKIGTTFRLEAHIVGRVGFNCGRCLTYTGNLVDIDTEWVLMSQAGWVEKYEEDIEVELNAEDLDISFYEGDTISLGELVRESIVLELPTHPVCVEDTAKCEATFEKNVGEEVLEEIEEAGIDLRWGPLKDIKLKD